MKILYLDLNYPDLIENYSQKPNAYGGGRIVPSALLHSLNDMGHTFDIWADPKCFEGVEEKYKSHCIPFSYDGKDWVRSGGAFPVLDYDIILHNFHSVKLNMDGLKAKDVVWLVGFGEHVNPRNKRVVLYNDYQNPSISNFHTRVYKARIGVPFESFQEYKKDDYVFSCHRQNISFGAKTMMELAHDFKFKYVTAGPKDQNFPDIMDYVDNKYVTYLGVISEEEKIERYKHAFCSTHLHKWHTPMNLGAVQSLSYGTPIIARNIGFWPSIVKEGVNGFFVNTNEEFIKALEGCKTLKQQDCYDSAKHLSTDGMVADYLNVFEQIMKE